MTQQLRPAASLMEAEFAAVLQGKDWETYQREIIGFSKALGLDRVNALLVTDRPGLQSGFEVIDNAPDGLVSIADAPSDARTDPVTQYCKHHSSPIAAANAVRTGLVTL